MISRSIFSPAIFTAEHAESAEKVYQKGLFPQTAISFLLRYPGMPISLAFRRLALGKGGYFFLLIFLLPNFSLRSLRALR
jgi:hypothetical protein